MIEIHTNHGDVGKPILTCKKIKCKKIEISISHEKNYAVATAIIIW